VPLVIEISDTSMRSGSISAGRLWSGSMVQLAAPDARRSKAKTGLSMATVSTSIWPDIRGASDMPISMRPASMRLAASAPSTLATLTSLRTSTGQGNSRASMGPSMVTARPVTWRP
jgi:hypothetical protein